MLPKYLLLIFMPAVVYGRIGIKIVAGKTKSDASVEFGGQNIAIISDKERQTFGIQDNALKNAVRIFFGKIPTDVFVKDPTPWNNVYHRYNWNQVQRVLKPVRARILGIKTKPVIVSTREFSNRGRRARAKYFASISHQVQESVGTTWSIGGELTVGQEITYNVNFAAGSVGGTTSLSYTTRWGNDTTKAKSVTLGTSTSVEVELAPGQAVVATLSATRGTLDIEVDYEAYLTGEVFANYRDTYKGHHFWAYPVEHVLQSAGLPKSVNSTEKISIGFYASANVEIRDKATSAEVQHVPAGFIPPMSDNGRHGRNKNRI